MLPINSFGYKKKDLKCVNSGRLKKDYTSHLPMKPNYQLPFATKTINFIS